MEKLFTKEELIENYDELEAIELPKGIKVDGEKKKNGLMREFTAKDKRAVAKDRRATNDVESSILLCQRLFYIEVDDDQYRTLTNAELDSLKGSDESKIAQALNKLTEDARDF